MNLSRFALAIPVFVTTAASLAVAGPVDDRRLLAAPQDAAN